MCYLNGWHPFESIRFDLGATKTASMKTKSNSTRYGYSPRVRIETYTCMYTSMCVFTDTHPPTYNFTYLHVRLSHVLLWVSAGEAIVHCNYTGESWGREHTGSTTMCVP